MEMCYDGALVMPSSFAMMNEDEMTYVYGGKFYGVNAYTGSAALYFGVAGTVLTLSSTWLSSASKKGGCHIGYDSSKKKWTKGWGKA